MQPERNLKRARPPRLIERTRWTETLVQHQRGLSEQCVGERRIDVSEVGVVEEIVGFSSKLQIEATK